jgi:hypothetical protein
VQELGIARTDLQQNVRLLSKMSTPMHAVSCLLASHEQAMEHQVKMLRNHVGVGSSDFEFLGAVSQRVFGMHCTTVCAMQQLSHPAHYVQSSEALFMCRLHRASSKRPEPTLSEISTGFVVSIHCVGASPD